MSVLSIGCYALGAFDPRRSDLDVIVVVDRPLTVAGLGRGRRLVLARVAAGARRASSSSSPTPARRSPRRGATRAGS